VIARESNSWLHLRRIFTTCHPRPRDVSTCQEVARRRYKYSITCQDDLLSIMRKVTWRRFDQSAKQLIVGQMTMKYDDPHLKMSHSGAHKRPCFICFVVWLTTHTRLTALCPGLPGWAVTTRKVKPIWILLKQETVSGSGTRHHSVFYRPDALPDAQPTASNHWRPNCMTNH